MALREKEILSEESLLTILANQSSGLEEPS